MAAQSSVHDLVETFVGDLAAASTSSSLRDRIANAFQRWTDAAGVVFFERTIDARYVCTQAVGASTGTVNGQGPLVRWLRVNNELLVFQDRPEVAAYLSSEERTYVGDIASDACMPLVAGGVLVGFLLLCQVRDPSTLSRRRPLLEAYATRAAEIWRHVTHTEELQARRDALGHSHRLGIAGQVAASVAHEVRNPLAAIRSLVQFAKDTPLPSDEHESILADVLEEVDRIDQTVTGMLQLSQAPASRRQAIDLADLLRAAIRFVRTYAQKRGVSVATGSLDPVQVLGDERELRQVMMNLLLNACQACDGGGRVLAVARREAPATDGMTWAEVEIRDSGTGIAAEHLPRVFEPFFTTRPQGTGLGLAFCRDVAERHGGDITVVSAVGEGTSVRVRLPILEVDELRPGG